MKKVLHCVLLAALAACGDDSTMTPDASMEDVGTDGGPECRSDRECDDGLFCNGAETCSDGGACVPGEEVLCDDGVACTFDLCDDELDRCVFAPPDEDGDGSGDAACVDGEGNPLGADCDDTDPLTFPGNPEVCDLEGHDEDCDPTTFGRRDVDGDGFFDAVCCNGDVCGTDCDDLRANANPATTEVCDAIDNDCDDTVDEGVRVAGFVDADRDGFGDHDMPLEACAGRAGFVPEGGPDDCDDADLSVNPGQVEICDGRDNDCDDGTTDADGRPVQWFADLDGDGFGSRASGIVTSCEPPAGHSLRDTDCDDDDAGRHPAAAEMCNGIDDDCNGVADFEIAPGDFEDDDGDGLVDVACGALGTDCDDRDASAGPGTAESCDGRDNDCDERVDEGAVDRSWFADVDGDGFGTDADPENPTIRSCVPPPGYVGNADDCADRDAARRPGASETCNTRDDDCDGAVDEGGVCGCPAGRRDCDGDGSCETDVRNDIAHCGACGAACALASSAEAMACRGGRCEVARCAPGRGDCDGFPANGCETSTTDDWMNCGGCEVGCAIFAPGVTFADCRDSACFIAECSGGLADCNRLPADGCETSTDDDPRNCGGCGVVCPSIVGPARCVAGSCVAPCVAGRTADCDGDPRNGCETELGTATDCSTCGEVCPAPAPGLSSTCNRGGSGVTPFCDVRCTTDRADCNDDLSDGCEASVSFDACGCPGDTVRNCAGAAGPGSDGRCVARAGSAECIVETCPSGEPCGEACVDVQTDAANCGSCGFSCGPGGSCMDGSCNCTGTTDCFGRGTCVDTTTDPANCGFCGNVCGPSQVCDAGTCRTECGAGLTDCGGACVNTRTDFFHCGACSNPCNSSQACERGVCERACRMPDQTRCGTACVRLAVDEANCGTCGNVCPPAGMENVATSECVEAACEVTCDAGFADCDADPATCETPIDSDPANCGGCGIDCGTGGVCDAGTCDTIVQVVTGPDHTCAVRSSGALVCWGQNSNGQLGVPTPTRSATPVLVPLAGVVEVGCGLGFTCAIAFDGGSGEDRIFCWGSDVEGRRGDAGGVGAPTDVPQLQTPPSGGVPLSLAVGEDHACALYDVAGSTQIRCWGSGADRANGGTVARDDDTLVTSTGQPNHLVAGLHHNCMEPEDTSGGLALECWGNNMAGQLTRAAGGPEASPTPGATMPFETITWMAMGDRHGCVVAGGRPWCWGRDDENQTGLGATTHVPTRTPALPGTVHELSLDASATCALLDRGDVWCRGRNFMERLFVGGPDPVSTWTRVDELGYAARQLSDGASSHRCAIIEGGDVVCWGFNTSGQVGNGNLDEDAAAPSRVLGLTD